MVRARSDDGQVVRLGSGECQVHIKSQSELEISGCETSLCIISLGVK